MLNFEHNISGGHAMVANVHDKRALNEANVFLKNLLQEEAEGRRVLTDEQQTHILDNVTRILRNLSVYVKDVLLGASSAHGVDYLEKAKARVQIMKISKAATPESAEGMQWYRNANSAEIVIQDHNRRPITQGRALQLAYDAMLKHAPDSMKYQDSLIALIQILGSDEAMNGCAEGAIGELLRATKPSHSDDKVVAEKFTTEQENVLRNYQLPQLKNLMVAMLDSWKFNRRVFSQKIRSEYYPSLFPEFMSLISKENHVMDQFLKVSNEHGRTLGTLGWDTILRGLRKKSVRKLFIEDPKSQEEEKIRKDIETILITPAIRAFIYGQYKPYLVNGSLNLGHYVNSDFVESIPLKRDSVRKNHAATKIQSVIRGKQARKQSQRIREGNAAR